jgi:hypothetical protein
MRSLLQTTRGLRAKGSYRIKNPFSPRYFAELFVFVNLIVGVLTVLGLALHSPIALALYFAVRVPVARYTLQRTAFGVVPVAVIVNGVPVQWHLVREVVVAGPSPSGHTTFTARLYDIRYVEDLPEHLRSLVPGPDGFELRHTIGTPYDPAKLRAALASFAPQNVTITGLDRPHLENGIR